MRSLIRVGDVYPDNMVQLAVRMYLYRWNDRLQEDTATAAPYEACLLLSLEFQSCQLIRSAHTQRRHMGKIPIIRDAFQTCFCLIVIKDAS